MGDEAEAQIERLTSIPKWVSLLDRTQKLGTGTQRERSGMAVQRRTARSKPATGREPVAKRNTRTSPARTKTAPAKPSRDVTVYAEKPATPYHKAFAKWIVDEVGLNLDGMSARQAFLKGVSIATAARPAFNESDFLEEWREKTGETKRGPKPKAEAAPTRRNAKAKPAPVEDDDDFEDDEIDEDDDFEDDDASDDSDDDDEFDDDDSDDDSDEDDDEFDDDEDDEPAPVKARTNSRARKAAPARSATSAKRAPAKATNKPAGRSAKAKAADDDDDFLF